MEPPRQNSGLIVDRFNALIRVKDDVVEVYEELLLELTINSKPIITDLTMIAGEQQEYAEGIADAILARISEVPVDQKLPALYLLDSIVKNIGHEYVRHFGARLPEVFCEAYNQVSPNMHPAMRHLFKTWSQVFPPSVLRKIENELLLLSTVETQRPQNQANVSSSTSPSPPPHTSHGIHVNPKYLEARQAAMGVIGNQKTVHVSDCEDSVETLSSKSLSGWSGAPPKIHDNPLTSNNISRPHSYNQNSSTKYGVYDYNRPDNPYVERSKTLNDPINHVNVRMPKPASPSRLRTTRSPSPIDYRFQRDDSFMNTSEKAYLRPPRLEYEHGTGYNKKHLRELIGTYGNHISQSTSMEKAPKLQRIDVNGNNAEKITKNWHNVDEEEYAWENMSPTLSSKRTNPPFGRVGLTRPDANSVDQELRVNNWNGQAISHHQVGDPAVIKDDRFPIIGSGHGSMHMKFPEARVGQNEQFGKFQYNLHHPLGEGTSFSRPWRPPPPLPSNGVTGTNNQIIPDVELLYQRLPSIHNTGSSHPITSMPERHLELRPPLYLPPIPKSQPLPLIPPPPIPDQFNSSYNLIEPNRPSHPAPNSYHSAAPVNINQQNQQSRFHGSYFPPLPQPINQSQLHPIGAVINTLPQIASTGAIQNISSEGAHGIGMRPVSSHMVPAAQNTIAISSSPVSAFSGLINNLMAQGVISLTPPAKTEDSVGLEFNTDLLKVRHESAINALYTDLPRQCTTCGLRFKCQEEHSTHMDWHVTKNRISKNRRQKPSRKWFVNTKEWMSGAETVGTEVVPFLPEETATEEEEKEMNVPADDNQTTCALCGELFEDFYSDEAEEWMYKGAVYMNAPDGNFDGLDRSMLGPIVHAKCRSDSGEFS